MTEISSLLTLQGQLALLTLIGFFWPARASSTRRAASA